MSNYTLREGCEPPRQPKVAEDDRKHPLYGEYLRYRAAMSAQLVSCPSFKDWVAQREEDDSFGF